MRFVNLTGHDVTDVISGKTIKKEKGKVHVDINTKTVKVHDDIPIRSSELVNIAGLPEPEEGVMYIVAPIVIHALKQHGIERDDVVAPGRIKYDEKTGEKIGCFGLRAD